MKRIAFLTACCMLVTGAFVSCGEDDSSSSYGNKATDAETTGTASSTSAVTSAATTEKAVTTSGEETTASENTSAAATEAPSAAAGSIVGKWSNEYSITEDILTFDEDGVFSDVTDYSLYMSVKGNKAMYVGLDADAVFEDDELRLLIDNEVVCRFSKFDDLESSNDIDGLYVYVPEEGTSPTFETNCAYYRINGEKTELIKDGTYTVEGDHLTITQTAPEGEGEINTEYTFTISGTTLKLTDTENGEEIICQKAV